MTLQTITLIINLITLVLLVIIVTRLLRERRREAKTQAEFTNRLKEYQKTIDRQRKIDNRYDEESEY